MKRLTQVEASLLFVRRGTPVAMAIDSAPVHTVGLPRSRNQTGKKRIEMLTANCISKPRRPIIWSECHCTPALPLRRSYNKYLGDGEPVKQVQSLRPRTERALDCPPLS